MRSSPGSAEVSEVLRTLHPPCSPRLPSGAPGQRHPGIREIPPTSAGAGWDQAKGSAPPDPRHLVERGFGFPFVGPSPPSPTAGRWRFLCLGWGSPRRLFSYWRTWSPSGGLEGRTRLPGGVFLEGRGHLGCVNPGAHRSCRLIRGDHAILILGGTPGRHPLRDSRSPPLLGRAAAPPGLEVEVVRLKSQKCERRSLHLSGSQRRPFCALRPTARISGGR